MCLRNFLHAGFQHNGVYYGTKHNPGYSCSASRPLRLPLGLPVGHLCECTKF